MTDHRETTDEHDAATPDKRPARARAHAAGGLEALSNVGHPFFQPVWFDDTVGR